MAPFMRRPYARLHMAPPASVDPARGFGEKLVIAVMTFQLAAISYYYYVNYVIVYIYPIDRRHPHS